MHFQYKCNGAGCVTARHSATEVDGTNAAEENKPWLTMEHLKKGEKGKQMA